MRKFKHKNTGVIGELREGVVYFQEKLSDIKWYQNSLSLSFIINSGDWEETIGDNYKILSVYHDNGGSVSVNEDHNLNMIMYQLALENNNKIQSVENAKGLKLSINDKVCWNWSEADVDYFTIQEFRFEDEEILVKFLNNNALFSINMDSLQHYIEPKPLFTTTDGVDVFKGDRYWVATMFHNKYEALHKQGRKNVLHKSPTFSTYEAAKKHIQLNKPKFSHQQVINFLDFLKIPVKKRDILLSENDKKFIYEMEH